MSLFTNPHTIPNLYDFFFFVQMDKNGYLKYMILCLEHNDSE